MRAAGPADTDKGRLITRRSARPLLAVTILVLAIAAATWAPGVSAKGSISGSCVSFKDEPSLPCSASEGQTYGPYTIPDGAEDSEASLEAVLGYVEGEPTDVTSVAYGLTDDTAEFDFAFPNSDSGTEAFAWKYSGEAPLAFLTVSSDEGAFAIYDIAKQTKGEIDVSPELGEFSNAVHFSFWQRTFSECVPVRVEDQHGTGMVPGCQLSEIVNGRVPCVHLTKETTSTCKFRTGKGPSGKWLEGIMRGEDSDFALANQAITKKGKRGGPWVIASKPTHDAGLPCKKPPPEDETKRDSRTSKRDTASATADGSLPASGYTEVATSTTNVHAPLVNYATRNVCGNTPPPHPDGAMLVSHPSASVWCYTGTGAGMNDRNGIERYSPAAGGGYIDDAEHRHFINYNGGTVAAAKRPNVKPNGELLPGSPIAWRPVAWNANIAN